MFLLKDDCKLQDFVLFPVVLCVAVITRELPVHVLCSIVFIGEQHVTTRETGSWFKLCRISK